MSGDNWQDDPALKRAAFIGMIGNEALPPADRIAMAQQVIRDLETELASTAQERDKFQGVLQLANRTSERLGKERDEERVEHLEAVRALTFAVHQIGVGKAALKSFLDLCEPRDEFTYHVPLIDRERMASWSSALDELTPPEDLTEITRLREANEAVIEAATAAAADIRGLRVKLSAPAQALLAAVDARNALPAVSPAGQLAIVKHNWTTALDKLRDVHKTQGQHGNWNYSPYMRGLYNGLELALAILEGERQPVYKDDPEVWLCDLPEPTDAEPVPAESATPLERLKREIAALNNEAGFEAISIEVDTNLPKRLREGGIITGNPLYVAGEKNEQ